MKKKNVANLSGEDEFNYIFLIIFTDSEYFFFLSWLCHLVALYLHWVAEYYVHVTSLNPRISEFLTFFKTAVCSSSSIIHSASYNIYVNK